METTETSTSHTESQSAPAAASGHPHLISITGRRSRLQELDNTYSVDRQVVPGFRQLESGLQTDRLNAQRVAPNAPEHSSNKQQKSLWLSYVLWLPPIGWFGAHHYYLHNYFFGVFYSLTVGGVGIGWLIDVARMPELVKRENARPEHCTKRMYVDDVYILHVPWGLLGLHHFYLGDRCLGLTWLLSLGCFGLGWLADLCLIPSYVHEKNIWCEYSEGHAVHAAMRTERSYAESLGFPVPEQLEWVVANTYVRRPPEYDTVYAESSLPPYSQEGASGGLWMTSQSGNNAPKMDGSYPPPPSYDDVISGRANS